ncbi:hypothetical protein B0H14DRAFT_3453468 [Mycena olivaceomarginata]|nr:hypothetical protein B0H14DRAFT_3453468 [Mycena olivaceomarginata]
MLRAALISREGSRLLGRMTKMTQCRTLMKATHLRSPLPAKPEKLAQDKFHHKPIVDKFPGGLAGRRIPSSEAQNSEQRYGSILDNASTTNPYAPFNSKMDWEVARWAKLRGSGSTAFTDLLHIGAKEERCAGKVTSVWLMTLDHSSCTDHYSENANKANPELSTSFFCTIASSIFKIFGI